MRALHTFFFLGYSFQASLGDFHLILYSLYFQKAGANIQIKFVTAKILDVFSMIIN